MTFFNRRLVLGLLAGAATLPFARLATAAGAGVSTDANGVAMRGYDTHAYWVAGAARAGTADHVVTWRGVPWHFATRDDAEMFRATPEAFAPQFGGFCTRALSLKKVVDGDPEVWRIHKNKLYLFARPVGGRHFDKGQDAMIEKAQAYWNTLG